VVFPTTILKNTIIRKSTLKSVGLESEKDSFDDGDKFFHIIYGFLHTLDSEDPGVYLVKAINRFIENADENVSNQIGNVVIKSQYLKAACNTLSQIFKNFANEEGDPTSATRKSICMKYLALTFFRRCWNDEQFGPIIHSSFTKANPLGRKLRDEALKLDPMEQSGSYFWQFWMKEFETGYPSILIGRNSNDLKYHVRNDIDLSGSSSVSSNNTLLKYYSGAKGWFIRDLGTPNGSYISLQSGKQYLLKPGDMFMFGDNNLVSVHDASIVESKYRDSGLMEEVIELQPWFIADEKRRDRPDGVPNLCLHVLGGVMKRSAFRNCVARRNFHLLEIILGRIGTTWTFEDEQVESVQVVIHWMPDVGWVLEPRGPTLVACNTFERFKVGELSAPISIPQGTEFISVAQYLLGILPPS